MRFGIAMSLAVCVLIVAAAPQIDVASEEFQGAWKLQSGETAGKAMSDAELKGGKLVIKDHRYSATLADLGTMTGTQKLGVMDKLKTIDITSADGPHKNQTCLGIYEIKENEFRVVFAQPGEPRPSKFETQSGTGQWLHVWKRVQE